MTTALIDGDTLIYSSTSSTEREEQWDTWEWTLTADLRDGIEKFQEEIERIKARLKPSALIIALSDSKRFRPLIDPNYKSGRVKTRKPVTYNPLREWVRENFKTYQKPLLEGDDVLGILATHPVVVPGDKIVVAIDKDLKQIPGKLYNYDKDELTEISEEQGDHFFYLQTLMGDVTDGYSGCPGVGPVKAEKILEGLSPEQVWPAIVAAYEKAGCTEADALRNARCARILRAVDYDFQKKEVIYWTPKALNW